jgi:hypoxanthine phosphoribosyltransferase
MQDELEVLLAEEEIRAKVTEIAGRIAADYEGKPLLMVGVLKGAWVFLADLVRRIPYPVEVDFIKVSSYGKATESTGEVKFEMDFSRAVEGKHLLIVEDIVDTGITLSYLKKNLWTRKPADVKLCTLLDKPERRKVEVAIDYKGFEIPDRFVVGYGLDCAECFRNLPHVAALTPEQAKKITGE